MDKGEERLRVEAINRYFDGGEASSIYRDLDPRAGSPSGSIDIKAEIIIGTKNSQGLLSHPIVLLPLIRNSSLLREGEGWKIQSMHR